MQVKNTVFLASLAGLVAAAPLQPRQLDAVAPVLSAVGPAVSTVTDTVGSLVGGAVPGVGGGSSSPDGAAAPAVPGVGGLPLPVKARQLGGYPAEYPADDDETQKQQQAQQAEQDANPTSGGAITKLIGGAVPKDKREEDC